VSDPFGVITQNPVLQINPAPTLLGGSGGAAGFNLPRISGPDPIRQIKDAGNTPVYHDTSLGGLLSIFKGGSIEPRVAPNLDRTSEAGIPGISVTRDFTNYSKKTDSPYRLVIDKESVGHPSRPVDPYGFRPEGASESEERFSKSVPLSSVRGIVIDPSNPTIGSDFSTGGFDALQSMAQQNKIPILGLTTNAR